MKDPRLLFKGFVPQQQEIFLRAWEECKWFLPRWVIEIGVEFNDMKTLTYSTCNCLQEYGLVTIEVFPPFFLSTDEQRRHALLHEIGHIHLWGITSLAKSIIKHAPRDARKQLDIRLQEHEERAVQEMSFALEAITPRAEARPRTSRRKQG